MDDLEEIYVEGIVGHQYNVDRVRIGIRTYHRTASTI